jgi:hypothetical protein
MQKIVLTIRDKSKINFLIELLKQFTFVEVEQESKKKSTGGSFFASAGLLKNRDISAKKLRTDAWKRSS